MLVAYLVSLIVGGVLLGLSLATGHHAGGDAGHVGASHQLGAGHAHGHGGGGGGHASGAADVLVGWFPVTSVRFWVFFAAFFGLAGTVLAGWGLAGFVPTLVTALAAGYGSGLLMDRTMRQLGRAGSDSSVGAGDLVGASGQVLLPPAPGKTGKVRLHLKGRSIDLLAETEDRDPIPAGEQVLVLSVRDEGAVNITRQGKEEE